MKMLQTSTFPPATLNTNTEAKKAEPQPTSFEAHKQGNGVSFKASLPTETSLLLLAVLGFFALVAVLVFLVVRRPHLRRNRW